MIDERKQKERERPMRYLPRLWRRINNYKIVEDNHYPRNKLTKEEQVAIGDILNNEECIVC